MTDIKTIRLGDIFIDENLFTKFCGLTDAVMSWPSEKENEGGVDYSGDLIWYLFRTLRFEKCKTAEGHNGWVITIDNRDPL